jgi:prolipoprotein diacylglyceryltransferase
MYRSTAWGIATFAFIGLHWYALAIAAGLLALWCFITEDREP